MYRRWLPADLVPYPPQPYFVQLGDGDLSRIAGLVPADQTLVIKLHGPLHDDIRASLDQGLCRAICTHRDPRDAAVSLGDAAHRERRRRDSLRRDAFTVLATLDECIATIAQRLADALPWLRHERVLRLDFDGLRRDPYASAQAICAYLGLTIDPAAVLLRYLADKHRIGEFNIGAAGRYRTCMTAAQERQAADACADWFELTGVDPAEPIGARRRSTSAG